MAEGGARRDEMAEMRKELATAMIARGMRGTHMIAACKRRGVRMSAPRFSQILNGRADPRPHEAEAITAALGKPYTREGLGL